MYIALLGATSQIAKDLVLSFSEKSKHELLLYARRPELVTQWLAGTGLAGRHAVADLRAFGVGHDFDAVVNFVGVGNPERAVAMGASIFDVTLKYDELALNYVVSINDLQPQDWYAVAKLHAECRHRALPDLPIIDLRVFNYFSSTQDLSARFLITDILRAIRDGTVLKTSSDYIVRDYLHPSDFHKLVEALLAAPSANAAVDCYSSAPIDKQHLLAVMAEKFGLRYEVLQRGPDGFARRSKSCSARMSHQTGFEKFLDLRLLKFLGTGILNTVFGYSVYAVLLFVDTSYPIALLLATVAGVVFNYISFGRLVFRAQGGWIVFGKFVIAYALAYGVNVVLLWLLVA